MKRIICDHCQTAVDPNEYGLAPLGWITLHQQTPTFQPTRDYCSAACTVAALTPEAVHA